MEEFIKREGGPDGRLPIPADKVDAINAAAEECDRKENGGKPQQIVCFLAFVSKKIISFLHRYHTPQGISAARSSIILSRLVIHQ
jgi:hypothetical protein